MESQNNNDPQGDHGGRWGRYEKLVLTDLKRLYENQGIQKEEIHNLRIELAVMRVKLLAMSALVSTGTAALIQKLL